MATTYLRITNDAATIANGTPRIIIYLLQLKFFSELVNYHICKRYYTIIDSRDSFRIMFYFCKVLALDYLLSFAIVSIFVLSLYSFSILIG